MLKQKNEKKEEEGEEEECCFRVNPNPETAFF